MVDTNWANHRLCATAAYRPPYTNDAPEMNWNKKMFQLPSSLHLMQSTMWSIQIIIIITITHRQFPFRPFGILCETMVHRPIPRSWICPICSVQLLLMKHDWHSIVNAANKWWINENRVRIVFAAVDVVHRDFRGDCDWMNSEWEW